MCNDAGCPVVMSDGAVPEVVLRDECYLVSMIVGAAISLPMTSQWIQCAISSKITRENQEIEFKHTLNGNSFVFYVETVKGCTIFDWFTKFGWHTNLASI